MNEVANPAEPIVDSEQLRNFDSMAINRKLAFEANGQSGAEWEAAQVQKAPDMTPKLVASLSTAGADLGN